MPDLVVIVDPNYGDRLPTAAQLGPVWVVATPTNKPACKLIWELDRNSDHREKGSVTSYEVTNAEDRLGNLLDIMPQLETHHGVVEHNYLNFPNGFVLEVIGLALDENVTSALRDFSFASFVETPSGFRATKHNSQVQ